MAPLLVRSAALLLARCRAQIPGPSYENHPPVPIARCTLAGGCELEQAGLTLDASYRWAHGVECLDEELGLGCTAAEDCQQDGGWSEKLCPDPVGCGTNCAIEGVNVASYTTDYGVTPAANGVELKFVTQRAGGTNVGSRLYLTDGVMDGDDRYRMFRLKNREFAFDVDVSQLPCGLNGAVYFVEMPEDGGKARGNAAGAKYGTGYCDAACPHNVKFMDGEVNMLEWDEASGSGRYGHCCAEMDLWEANSHATAYTAHPCEAEGPHKCEGEACGSACDQSGCGFNSFRNGDEKFYGPGPEFTVDTTKPFTVVTQWITADGTDDGELVDIRRIYVQDGRLITNSDAQALGGEAGNSLSEKYCAAAHEAFGDGSAFASGGAGFKKIGAAAERGMVLALSVWADMKSHMAWLDATLGHGVGSARGPCSREDAGDSLDGDAFADVSVTYTNFMHGEIGSTVKYRTGTPAMASPRLYGDLGGPVRGAGAGGAGDVEGARVATLPALAMLVAVALATAAGLVALGRRRLLTAARPRDTALDYGLVAERSGSNAVL